jgi:CDP-diacylglycerol--glycerol-3-phosphate 3-phosphatidyltransferase
MPSIYELKPRFQALLRPLTARLAAAGVSANQVTLAAMLLSLAAGGAIALFPGARALLLLIPVLLFVRMALNAIDGMLAREHGMKSAPGAILNELGDVVSDAALYLPLALIPGVSPVLTVVAVVLAVASEMSGVVAVQIGASRRYDGPMGKSDRAFVFGLIALLLGMGVTPGPWLTILLAAVCALLVATILRRAGKALEELAQAGRG